MAKIERITNFTNSTLGKRKGQERIQDVSYFATFLSSNFVMHSIFAKMKSSVTNVTLFIITDSSKIL